MRITYSCDFCGETYENREICRGHEAKCGCNPKNRSCETCKNWSFDPNEGPIIFDDGEREGHQICSLPDFEPYRRDCDGWELGRGVIAQEKEEN